MLTATGDYHNIFVVPDIQSVEFLIKRPARQVGFAPQEGSASLPKPGKPKPKIHLDHVYLTALQRNKLSVRLPR